jgi:hypothetical protein
MKYAGFLRRSAARMNLECVWIRLEGRFIASALRCLIAELRKQVLQRIGV